MLNIEQATEINRNHNSILSCNIQSFNQAHTKIKTLINELKFPQVVLLQEIWHPKINTHIPNYQTPLQATRILTRGGGLSIYIRDDLDYDEFKEINDLKTNEIEKLAVRINNKKQFILVNIYRPPNSNIKEGLKEISKIMEIASKTGIPFSLIGDFNIDLAHDNHVSKKYTDLLQTFNCIQTVNLPTRISSFKKSIIDHCIRSNDFVLTSNVLETQVSDHQPILINWNKKTNKDTFKSNKIEKINYEKLKNILSSNIQPLETHDCDEAFNILHNTIVNAVNQSKYIISRKNKPKKPYISEQAVKLGRQVEMLRKKFFAHNTTYNEYRYKSAKREHQKLVRYEKNNYYLNRLEQTKGDSGKIWQIINETLSRNTEKYSTIRKRQTLVHNDRTYESNLDIANCFNKFYRDIALEIANNIKTPSHNFDYHLKKSKQPSAEFELIENNRK